MLRILFVHNNFPAQFARLSSTLAAMPDVDVRAIGSRTARPQQGVTLSRYRTPAGSPPTVHPFVRRFERDARYGEEVLYAGLSLQDEGFEPDVVFVHPGWGEGLPLRLLFPHARIVVYAEFFYRAHGADLGFDDQYPPLGIDGLLRVEMRNASQLLALCQSDAIVAPTLWQKSLYPAEFRPSIDVIHDGIDTRTARPDPKAQVQLPNGLQFSRADKLLTYVSRSLEPMRGFHVFLETLPELLRLHPDLQVVVVGSDKTSYGAAPVGAPNWRDHYMRQLQGEIDPARLHFFPRLDYTVLLDLFRTTRVHFHYSYPFVLSWSLLEAMACGAVVVGSRTPPVEEVIEDGVNGYLRGFRDTPAAIACISDILAQPQRHAAIGRNARNSVVKRFDFETVSKPACFALLRRLGYEIPTQVTDRPVEQGAIEP